MSYNTTSSWTVTIFDDLKNDSPQSFKSVLDHITRHFETHGVGYRIVSFNGFVPFHRGSTINLLITAFYRLIAYPIQARRHFSQESPNLLMSSGLVHMFLFAKPGCPLAVVCHDVFPFLSRRALGHRLDYGGWFRQVFLRIYQKKAFQCAHAIIVPSDTTKRDVIEALHVDPARLTVIPHSVDLRTFRPGDRQDARRALNLPEELRLVLAIASPERRKNLCRLMEAFRLMLDRGVKARLILLGLLSRNQLKTLRRLALTDSTIRLSNLDIEDVARCYQAADCTAYVSLYEGFGLPVIEAMGCGCPVVCSDRGAIPEIAGEAALYVDALCVNSIAEGMSRVLRDGALSGSMVAAGVEQARKFGSDGDYSTPLRSLLPAMPDHLDTTAERTT